MKAKIDRYVRIVFPLDVGTEWGLGGIFYQCWQYTQMWIPVLEVITNLVKIAVLTLDSSSVCLSSSSVNYFYVGLVLLYVDDLAVTGTFFRCFRWNVSKKCWLERKAYVLV